MTKRSFAMPGIAPLLALLVLLAPAPSEAAGSAALQCSAAIAKALSKCVKTGITLHSGCYKASNQPCAANDAKLSGAYAGVPASVQSKCTSTQIISDAGYAPFTVANLGAHFKDMCRWQVDTAVARTFGSDGSYWASADADGRKCLQGAAKASSGYLSKAFGALAKCTTASCITDVQSGSAEVTAATASVTKSCPDLAAVAGRSAQSYMEAAQDQIPSAIASPCDPMDTTRCVFPYPNDLYTIAGADTASGRQLAIGRKSVMTVGSNTPMNTERWREADGFSIGPMLMFQDANLDLEQTGAAPITDVARSLDADAPMVLIDADNGEKQLLWWERDVRGLDTADQPIIGRVAKNLKQGHRYIVALRNLKDAGGNPLSAGAAFAAYRDNTPTTQVPFESRRPHMEEIFTTLAAAGITRSSLYLAWDFTTQSADSTSKRLLHMRDDAFGILGSAAPSFTVDSVQDNVNAKVFRQVDGTFQVPLYLVGGGVPGSALRVDGYGTPYNSGDFFTANYRCIIPYTATTSGGAPANPARISMYGHGLLGSHDEVSAGNVQDFANEHDIIFCATDWTGFEDADTLFVAQVLADFSNFPVFIDRQHQGILNMLFLGRLMKHASGFASNAAFQIGGESMIDGSDVFYDGNSQGGILGGVLAAFSQDATRFSLGVPGMNYSTLLYRSSDFLDFEALLTNRYPKATDRNLVQAIAQTIWDRTDPNGHVQHQLSDPYANTPAKKILYQVAYGDHQVAPVTVEVAARTNGAYIHKPVLLGTKDVPEVTPYYGIPEIPSYPFDGSAMVVWDAGNPAPPLSDWYPAEINVGDPGYDSLASCAQTHHGDPHSCPRSNPTARTQKSEFLKTNGAIVDVCSGAACLITP